MIQVRKYSDIINCQDNADLDALVLAHGGENVLVDGVSVAEKRAAEAAQANDANAMVDAVAAADAVAADDSAGQADGGDSE